MARDNNNNGDGEASKDAKTNAEYGAADSEIDEDTDADADGLTDPADVEVDVPVGTVGVRDDDRVNQCVTTDLRPTWKAERRADDMIDSRAAIGRDGEVDPNPKRLRDAFSDDDDGDDDDGDDDDEDGRDLPVAAGTSDPDADATDPGVTELTSDADVVSVHCRVIKTRNPSAKHPNDVEVMVTDESGTAEVRLYAGLGIPDIRPGDEVVMERLDRQDANGCPAFEQSEHSEITVIKTSRYPVGYRLERQSALRKAPDWYQMRSNADARERVKTVIESEMHIETPRGDDTMWIYVDDPDHEDYGTFVDDGESYITSRLEEHLPNHKKRTNVKRQIVEGLKDQTRVPADRFSGGTPDEEELRWSVGVENGVIDLRTGELHDHGPEWRLQDKLPVKYRPDEYDGLGPEMDWFLSETMKSESDRESLLYMLGHALCKCYPAEAVWSITGPGGNGKTRLLEAIDAMFGSETVNYSMGVFAGDSDFGAGPLKGGRLAVDDDATSVNLKHTQDLKKHSGGYGGMINVKNDPMSGEGYSNYATIMYMSNDPPMFDDKSRGMKRRVYPIIMPYQFSDDPTDDLKNAVPKEEIRERIQSEEELEALLAVAVQYASKLHGGKIDDGRSKDERWELYEQYSDAVLRFWSKCARQSEGARVTRQAIYEIYVRWCDRHGVDTLNPGGRGGFWSVSDQCHGISFVRDGVYLDGDRAVKHVELTPEALEYAPEWISNKWEADIDEDETTLANRLDRTTPIAELDGGYATTEGRVIAKSHADQEQEVGVQLTIEDDTTAIDVLAWDGGLDGVSVGDRIKLSRCELTQYRGVPQIKIKPPTEVEVVERGEQSGRDVIETDDEEVIDPGNVHAKIGELEKAGDGPVTVGDISEEMCLPEDAAENMVSNLAGKGEIYEPAPGKWRTT